MKLKNIISAVTLSMIFNSAISQVGLVHNAGFEDKDDDSKPTELGEIYFLEVWIDEIKEKSEDCNDDTFNEDYKLHSPDWFCSSGGFINIIEGAGNVPIEGHSGSCYIGMSPCELIQQQFFDDNQLIEENDYTLSMYIRLPATQNTILGTGQNAPTSGSGILKAYINQDKIDYSDAANDPCERCTDGCDKRITDNNPVEIMSIEVNTTNFPPGQWHKVSATFTAPAQVLKNDWLTIELQDASQCTSLYVLIDDVTLKCGCEVECSRTDHCAQTPYVRSACGPDDVLKTWINKQLLIRMSNFANATKVDVIIRNGIDQVVFTKTVACDNGIDGDIYWDGRNNNGAELAIQEYYYLTLFVENGCGIQEFNCQSEGFNCEIFKYDHFWASIPGYEFYCPYTHTDFVCNEYNLITPEPCCSAQPDIYLSNISIGNPETIGNLQYSAVNNIYIGPNVIIESDASVLFQAGNEIIGDFQEVAIGANVVAEIVPCPSGRMANPNFTSDRNATSTIAVNEQQTETQNSQLPTPNSQLKLYPNPNNGTMQMDYRLQEGENGELIIYDITGRRVKRILLASQNNTLQIQDSELKDGMYLYHVVVNGEIMVSEKLVVIR